MELHVNILSNLPARDIQKCRGICRHFLAVIDLEQNLSLLLDRKVKSSVADMQAFVQKHCHFPFETVDERVCQSCLMKPPATSSDIAALTSTSIPNDVPTRTSECMISVQLPDSKHTSSSTRLTAERAVSHRHRRPDSKRTSSLPTSRYRAVATSFRRPGMDAIQLAAR